MAHIDVSPRVAGFDANNVWHDPGNGQFAKPGWSTAKGLALGLIHSLADLARDTPDGIDTQAKGDSLRSLGIPTGGTVRARYVDATYATIDVTSNGRTRRHKVKWDTLDLPAEDPAVETTPVTRFAERLLDREPGNDETDARLLSDTAALFDFDLGDGYTSQTDRVRFDARGLHVTGVITDPDGTAIGTFTRVIEASTANNEYGGVEVAHSTLSIDPNYQGKGLGSKFLAASLDSYRNAGVDRVTVLAASSRGGAQNGAYTWAKAGFDWDIRADLAPVREIGDLMVARDKNSALGRRLRSVEDDQPLPDDFPIPLDVAVDPVGAEVLKSNDLGWSGVIALSDRGRGDTLDLPSDLDVNADTTTEPATPAVEDLPPAPDPVDIPESQPTTVRDRIRQQSLFAEDFGFTGTVAPTLFTPEPQTEPPAPLVVDGLDGLADALSRVRVEQTRSRFSDRVGYTATMDPDDAAEVERFAARLFDHHTPTAASNTARIRPTALADGRPGFIVDGTLNLPDGTQIGVWERQIAADRTGDNIVWAVRGTGLTIAPEYRGQGYGPWFDTAADETLSDIGFDHIVVDAVTDPAADLNGAHTYATAGYDWDTSPAGVAAVNAIGADLLADNPDSKIGRALAEWDGTITDRTPTPLDVVQDPDGALLMRYGQTSWIGRRSFAGNRTDIVPVDDPEVDTLSGSSIGELLAHNAPYRPFPPSVQTAVENAAVVWFTHDLGDGYTSRVDTVRFARNSASATPVTVTGVIVDRDGNETRFTRILRRADMSDPTAPTPGGDTIVVDHEPFVGPLDETVAATFDGTVFDKYRTGGGPQAAVVRSAAGNNMATAARSGFDWNRADWETVQAIGVSMLETDPDSEIGAALTADTWTTDTPTPLDVYTDPVGRLVLSGKTGPVSWTGVRRFDSNERDPKIADALTAVEAGGLIRNILASPHAGAAPEGDADRVAAALFAHDFPGGFSSAATAKAVANPAGGIQIAVTGVIKAADGKTVGKFSRTITHKPGVDRYEIDNDSFVIDADIRGQGLGAAFTAATLDAYRDAGIDRVTTFAVSSNGGHSNGAYTWAVLGFDWDTGTRGLSNVREVGSQMLRLDPDSVIGMRLATDPIDESSPTPLDVAMDPVGKRVLLGDTRTGTIGWLGYRDLTGTAREPVTDPGRERVGLDPLPAPILNTDDVDGTVAFDPDQPIPLTPRVSARLAHLSEHGTVEVNDPELLAIARAILEREDIGGGVSVQVGSVYNRHGNSGVFNVHGYLVDNTTRRRIGEFDRRFRPMAAGNLDAATYTHKLVDVPVDQVTPIEQVPMGTIGQVNVDDLSDDTVWPPGVTLSWEKTNSPFASENGPMTAVSDGYGKFKVTRGANDIEAHSQYQGSFTFADLRGPDRGRLGISDEITADIPAVFEPLQRRQTETIELPDPGYGVQNYLLTLDASQQGQGIGSRFIAASDDAYRRVGFDQVVTHAVSDPGTMNGAYTWAKAGYDWMYPPDGVGAAMLAIDPDSVMGATIRDYDPDADHWSTLPTPLEVALDPVGKQALLSGNGDWWGTRPLSVRFRELAEARRRPVVTAPPPVSDPDPVDTVRWTVGEMVDPDNTALFPAGTEFSTDVDRYVALGDDMFDNEGVTITGERLRQQLGTEQVYIETIPNASGDEPTGTSVQRPGPEAVDLGSWSSVRPWEVQRDPNSSDPADLLLNGERAPSWLRFETGHGQEAAHRGDHIVVTPKFFDLPESARRSVMYHEAGHGLSDMMLDDGSAFELVDHLPAWGNLNGQTAPGEIAAEAYAILWTEPEWLDTNAPDIRDIVTAKAIEHGYPLPDATAPTAGRGQTVAPSGERRVPGWYVTAMSTDRQITVLDENGEPFTGRVTSVQPNAGTFEIESGDDFRVLPAASTVVVGSTGTDPWSDGGMDYRYRNTDYRIGGDGTVRKTGSLDPVAERTAERIRNQALGDAADLLEPLPQPAPDTAPDTVEPEPTVTPFRSRMEATFYNETERAAEIAEFEALPDDAMVVVFHGTSADRAANIEATRTVARSSREDHVSSVTQSNGLYVAPTYIDAERYAGKGGKVVEMVVPKWMIEPSPEAANKSAGQALYHTYEGAVIPEGSALNVVAIHDGRTPDTPDTVLNGPRPDTVFQNGYRNGAVIETRGGLPRGAGREYTITTEDGRQYRMIGSDTHGLRYHPIGEPTTSEDSWFMLPGDGPFTISDIVARTGDRREDGADSAVAALKNTLLATPSGEALAPLLWADDLSPAEWFSEDITERVGVADRTGSLPGVEDALKALRTETLRAARRGGEGLARRDPLPQRFYRIESVDIGVAGGKTRTETSVLWSTTPPTPDAPAYALTSGQMSHVLNNPDGTPAFAWTTNAIGIPLFDPPDVENPSSEQARSDVGVKFSTGMVDLDANMWETNRNYMSPRAALIDALTNGGYATPRNPRWSQPGTPVKSVVIGPDGAVSWTPDQPGTGDATPVDGEVVFSIDDPKLPSALTAATEHTNRAVMASTLASLQNGGGRGGQVGDVGGDYKRWLTDRGRDIHNNHFSGASTKADYDHDTGSFTPSETGEYTIDGNDAIRGFADLDPDGNPRLWLPADARARIVGLTVDYTKVRDKSVPLDERVASLAEQRTTLQRLLPGATASAWFQGPVGDNVVKAIIDGTADAETMEQVRRIELIQEFGTEIANLVAEQRAQSLLDRHHVDDDVNREILDAAFAGVFGRELQQYASRNTRPSNPAGQAIVDLAAQVEGNPPPGVPLFRVESVHVDPNLDDPTSPTFDWGFTVARPDGSARVRVTIGRQTSNQAVVVSFSGEVGHRGDSTGPITLHTDGHFDDVRRLHTVLSANADIAPPTNEIAATIAANRRRSRTAPRTPAGPVQPYAPEHTVEAFSTLLADAGIDGFGLYGFSVDGDGIPQIRGDRAELTAVRTGSKDGVRHAKFVFVTEPGTYYERTFTVTVKATNEVELNRTGTRRVVGRINSSDNDGAYDAAVALAARLKQHAPTVDKPKVERETRVRVDASSVVDSGPMRIFHDIMGSLGIDMSTDETVRIGNGGQGALKPISEANQNLAETARAGLAVFPRSWTTALSANRPVRLQLRTGNVDFRSEGGFNRAASRAGEPDLISTPDISLRPDYADVAGHEFGHTFQHFIPGLLAAEQWHLMARLAANPAKSKPKPFGRRSRYGRQDYLYEDEFARSYSGRTYDGGISEAREVLTTAVQGLYTDSSFGSDPRLQGWAIGMMALLDPTGGGNASIGTTTTADRVAREDMTVAELLGGTFNADTIRAVLKDGGLTDTQRAALRQILDTLS